MNANSITRNVNYTEVELVNECHLSFVQKLTNKTCLTSTRSSRKPPPLAHSTSLTFNVKMFSFCFLKFAGYGYGFLAVFIISVLSLAGFLAFPLMKKPYYKYFNAFFTALAVGTLFSDAAFELLPVVCKRN